ncbi:dentin sialophosphoprotein-like [Polistes fuscatus]|uniref:dentin sialophosphoprotein-like n=1 Tax=Polistes fuscatus TaxID=30207 RepID=UPI001CA80A55|nr:dentin sialophosphoprotein-like [Polistes fuscatus]
MSDEELVQCPINPNHRISRSKIESHIQECRYTEDPDNKPYTATSSQSEPRPSTSSQEPLDIHRASTSTDPYESFCIWRSFQTLLKSRSKLSDRENEQGSSNESSEKSSEKSSEESSEGPFKTETTETVAAGNNIKLQISSWSSDENRAGEGQSGLNDDSLYQSLKLFRITNPDRNVSSDKEASKSTATDQQRSSTKPDDKTIPLSTQETPSSSSGYVPGEQSERVVLHGETTDDSESPRKKRKQEEADTEEIMQVKTSQLPTQETPSTSSGYVPGEQSERVVLHGETTDDSESPRKKRKQEEADTEEIMQIKTSQLPTQETPSTSSGYVPGEQSERVVLHGETTDDSESPKKKRKQEEADTEEIMQVKKSQLPTQENPLGGETIEYSLSGNVSTEQSTGDTDSSGRNAEDEDTEESIEDESLQLPTQENRLGGEPTESSSSENVSTEQSSSRRNRLVNIYARGIVWNGAYILPRQQSPLQGDTIESSSSGNVSTEQSTGDTDSSGRNAQDEDSDESIQDETLELPTQANPLRGETTESSSSENVSTDQSIDDTSSSRRNIQEKIVWKGAFQLPTQENPLRGETTESSSSGNVATEQSTGDTDSSGRNAQDEDSDELIQDETLELPTQANPLRGETTESSSSENVSTEQSIDDTSSSRRNIQEKIVWKGAFQLPTQENPLGGETTESSLSENVSTEQSIDDTSSSRRNIQEKIVWKGAFQLPTQENPLRGETTESSSSGNVATEQSTGDADNSGRNSQEEVDTEESTEDEMLQN